MIISWNKVNRFFGQLVLDSEEMSLLWDVLKVGSLCKMFNPRVDPSSFGCTAPILNKLPARGNKFAGNAMFPSNPKTWHFIAHHRVCICQTEVTLFDHFYFFPNSILGFSYDFFPPLFYFLLFHLFYFITFLNIAQSKGSGSGPISLHVGHVERCMWQIKDLENLWPRTWPRKKCLYAVRTPKARLRGKKCDEWFLWINHDFIINYVRCKIFE